jgi:hypothetical protein
MFKKLDGINLVRYHHEINRALMSKLGVDSLYTGHHYNFTTFFNKSTPDSILSAIHIIGDYLMKQYNVDIAKKWLTGVKAIFKEERENYKVEIGE